VPGVCALTLIAATVRFSTFAIFAAPAFDFAAAFNVPTSSLIQRRMTFSFLLRFSCWPSPEVGSALCHLSVMSKQFCNASRFTRSPEGFPATGA
jgi:hypothetical protein